MAWTIQAIYHKLGLHVAYEQNAKVTAFVQLCGSSAGNSVALWCECGLSQLKTMTN